MPKLLRAIHFWLGALLALNFVVLIFTGTLVQHRAFFRLEERTVNRKWLPSGYRLQDPDTEIRADIVVTDLHSGRIFGPWGPVVVDAAAAGLFCMIITGFLMQTIYKYRNTKDKSQLS